MFFHQQENSKGEYQYNAYQYRNIRWLPHFHRSLELICLREGALSLTVGGKKTDMRQGQYALILSNQVHAIEPIGEALYWIAVFSEQYVPLFAKTVECKQGVSPVFECTAEVNELLQSRLMKSDCTLMMKKACFYAACDCYLQTVPLEERSARRDEVIVRILDYVAAHYREPVTLLSVADAVGYEYHYLSRLLHKQYRIDFSQLVNGYRVDHAIRLLEESCLPVTAIAVESGFQSIRNFNQVFLQTTGRSPSEYLEHAVRATHGFVGIAPQDRAGDVVLLSEW